MALLRNFAVGSFLAGLGTACSAFSARADSLDNFCKTALLPSSIAICGDPELRALAVERQHAYDQAKAGLGSAARAALLADQNGWVKTYPMACGLRADMRPTLPLSPEIQQCMAHAGRARIAYLRTYARANVVPPVVQTPASALDNNQPELLPEVIYGVMIGRTDNVCPTWNNAIQAKEIIVYLTQAIEVSADAIEDIKANTKQVLNDPAANSVLVANINQLLRENQIHSEAMAYCRALIANELGLTEIAVRRLVEYNILTKDEYKMFSEMESDNDSGNADFSKLIAFPDQRQALHMIDLKLRELNYELAQLSEDIVKDEGRTTEETDRRTIARKENFRERSAVVRTSIANK
jgi:uncharacterized protein